MRDNTQGTYGGQGDFGGVAILNELREVKQQVAEFRLEGVKVGHQLVAFLQKITTLLELRDSAPDPEPASKRMTPVEKAKLIQTACTMLPDWKANTSAIARELGVNRKLLERSKTYQRARAIECSINPDDYRE